jgi:hypothetical protein
MSTTPEGEAYTRLRDYLKHEDSLINWRLTWNFALQPPLIAAYAYIQPATNVAGNAAKVTELHDLAQAGLPALGLLIGLTSFVGVVAAQRSITHLTLKWERIVTSSAASKDHFPPLSGGGSHFATALGSLTSLGPILALWVAWAAILGQRISFAGWALSVVGAFGVAGTFIWKPKPTGKHAQVTSGQAREQGKIESLGSGSL